MIKKDRKKQKGTRARTQQAGPARRSPRAGPWSNWQAGPGGQREREARGGVGLTSSTRQQPAGDAPATPIAQYATPLADSSRISALRATGDLKPAAPLPETKRATPVTRCRGAKLRTTAATTIRKRERGIRAQQGAGAHPLRSSSTRRRGAAGNHSDCMTAHGRPTGKKRTLRATSVILRRFLPRG